MADQENFQTQYPWLVPLLVLCITVLVAWIRQTSLSFSFFFFSVSSIITQLKAAKPLKPYIQAAQKLAVLYRLMV